MEQAPAAAAPPPPPPHEQELAQLREDRARLAREAACERARAAKTLARAEMLGGRARALQIELRKARQQQQQQQQDDPALTETPCPNLAAGAPGAPRDWRLLVAALKAQVSELRGELAAARRSGAEGATTTTTTSTTTSAIQRVAARRAASEAEARTAAIAARKEAADARLRTAAAIARRSVLERELAVTRGKLALVLSKSANDDALIAVLKGELVAAAAAVASAAAEAEQRAGGGGGGAPTTATTGED